MLIFLSQNCKSFSTLSINGLFLLQKNLFSISKYMLLLKFCTKIPKAKCLDENCPEIFASCLKILFSKGLRVFLFGTESVNSTVSIIVPNHFPFALEKRSLSSLLISKSAERKLFLTKSFKTSEYWDTVVNICDCFNSRSKPTFVEGLKTFVKM